MRKKRRLNIRLEGYEREEAPKQVPTTEPARPSRDPLNIPDFLRRQPSDEELDRYRRAVRERPNPWAHWLPLFEGDGTGRTMFDIENGAREIQLTMQMEAQTFPVVRLSLITYQQNVMSAITDCMREQNLDMALGGGFRDRHPFIFLFRGIRFLPEEASVDTDFADYNILGERGTRSVMTNMSFTCTFTTQGLHDQHLMRWQRGEYL